MIETKRALVITTLIVVVAASTIAMSIGPVYAPGGTCARCGAQFAPGLLGDPSVLNPGILSKLNGLPATQFAPGQQAKITPDP